MPFPGARPKLIANAGVLGGPGLYGVSSFDSVSIPGAVGIGKPVIGPSSDMVLAVVVRESERPLGLERFSLCNGRRLGGDEDCKGEGGMSSGVGGAWHSLESSKAGPAW